MTTRVSNVHLPMNPPTSDPPTSIESFWTDGLERLPDNHYTKNQSFCDICRRAEAADAPDNGSGSMSSIAISSTEVVKIVVCKHIYHAKCLHSWVVDSVQYGQVATCPSCFRVLIRPHPTHWLVPSAWVDNSGHG